LPSLWKDIAAAGDALSLLSSLGDELAAHRRHRCFHSDGHLLPAQEFLITIRGWDQVAMLFNISRMQEPERLMSEMDKTTSQSFNVANEELWPGIDSMYRLVIVAALRNKQLLRGSYPRIEADQRRRRNTSIALEEVKRGLVPFTINGKARKENTDGSGPQAGEG
jgi:DNA-directed RNA polymerase omega subunit